MTLREELVEYADRSVHLIEESPQMDEENTKRKIIEPLIDLLGWNILSSDVELEYSVPMGSGTKKVDYALKLDGTPVVFVEAKGCDTALEQSHESQLKSYMRQVGVDWGLLSNGRTFEIFRRDLSSSRPNEISLAKFSIERVPENGQPLKALSSDSIHSGESRQIAENIEAVQQAIRALRKNKEAVAEGVTGVVTEVSGKSISQHVEDEAKNFVDTLIDSLEGRVHRDPVVESVAEKRDGNVQNEDSEGYSIRFFGNGEQVHHVSKDVQSEAMAASVDYLIEEEGLLDTIEMPYIPGTGRGNRALLHYEPTHPDGSQMRAKKPVSGGNYVYTSLNSDSKRRYVSELAERVDLTCEFSEDW